MYLNLLNSDDRPGEDDEDNAYSDISLKSSLLLAVRLFAKKREKNYTNNIVLLELLKPNL